METKTLEDYRPDVGSDEVKAEQSRVGFVNRHVAAERVALQNAPDALLSLSQLRARRDLQKAQTATAKALARFDETAVAERAVLNAEAAVETAKQRVIGAERALALCETDRAGFADDVTGLNLALEKDFQGLLERGRSAAIAEHLLRVLPDTISKLRAELATRESELESLRKKLET